MSEAATTGTPETSPVPPPATTDLPQEAVAKKPSVLSVEKVDLHYGAAQALRQVSLGAESGRITCLLGRNGVGKTSMLRAIMGIHGISSGQIVWEGTPLGKLAPYQRAARGIAYVPQGREIFSLLTVRENLETGFANNSRADRNVPDYIYDLFPVLKTMLRRRGGDLSGGQQQQLAIARALVSRPRLLVLDEPTEGIQPSIIKDIGRAIIFLKEKFGLAILLVEQYLDFARELADTIAIMDRGRIVVSGAPEQLDNEDARRYLTV